MTTRATPFLSELASGEPIPAHKLAYFRARTRNRLYNFIVRKFLEKEQGGLSKADLARRIGKKPEVISRLIGAPGNWTIDTVSDLLLGIAAEELVPDSEPLIGRTPRNLSSAEWLRSHAEQASTVPPKPFQSHLGATETGSGTSAARLKLTAP